MKDPKIITRNLTLHYGAKMALNSISLNIPEKEVTAFIGPSGCGKSTFLRTLNRMNDLIPNVKISGQVLVDQLNIYDKQIDVVNLRKKIGMVFQKSNPFAKSIFENVAYGPKINGVKDKKKARGDCRDFAAKGGHLERSEGPPARFGARTVGRAAAAHVHCPDTRR
jgi:phosphate transport system ATP-binding protein